MRANPMQEVWWQATAERRSRRAWLLAALSLGLLWWLSARRVRQVARAARSEVQPQVPLLVPAQGLDGGEIAAEYGRRLQRVVLLTRENPARRLMLTGRSQQAASRGEAAAGLRWMQELGLASDTPVSLDEIDGDTADDLRCASARTAPGERIAIVSNRYHLARCGWIARGMGLNWQLCAAESQWRGSLCCQLAVAREALALLALGGWRAAFFDADLLADPDPLPEHPG